MPANDRRYAKLATPAAGSHTNVTYLGGHDAHQAESQPAAAQAGISQAGKAPCDQLTVGAVSAATYSPKRLGLVSKPCLDWGSTGSALSRRARRSPPISLPSMASVRPGGDRHRPTRGRGVRLRRWPAERGVMQPANGARIQRHRGPGQEGEKAAMPANPLFSPLDIFPSGGQRMSFTSGWARAVVMR